jgi:hypothetical protein
MFEGTLGLSAPELVGGYFNDAEAVSFFPHAGHRSLSFALRKGVDKARQTLASNQVDHDVDVAARGFGLRRSRLGRALSGRPLETGRSMSYAAFSRLVLPSMNRSNSIRWL